MAFSSILTVFCSIYTLFSLILLFVYTVWPPIEFTCPSTIPRMLALSSMFPSFAVIFCSGSILWAFVWRKVFWSVKYNAPDLNVNSFHSPNKPFHYLLVLTHVGKVTSCSHINIMYISLRSLWLLTPPTNTIVQTRERKGMLMTNYIIGQKQGHKMTAHLYLWHNPFWPGKWMVTIISESFPQRMGSITSLRSFLTKWALPLFFPL